MRLHVLDVLGEIMRRNFFTCEHAERRKEKKSNKNMRRPQKATMYGEAEPSCLLLRLLLRTTVKPERNRSRRTHLCSFSSVFPFPSMATITEITTQYSRVIHGSGVSPSQLIETIRLKLCTHPRATHRKQILRITWRRTKTSKH